ncbi:hypothetical protein FA13DRAFT_841551 [Coprinellus micaceus]|uniref:Uncharacterized protein n=1 Tax=Coprinellus micaceus TaxID=71717 RepID=A0A4Y7T1L8_COPMI|nr:hypothetical protein FA13DRAFT_841551 [Coprinellus micaceus]
MGRSKLAQRLSKSNNAPTEGERAQLTSTLLTLTAEFQQLTSTPSTPHPRCPTHPRHHPLKEASKTAQLHPPAHRHTLLHPSRARRDLAARIHVYPRR